MLQFITDSPTVEGTIRQALQALEGGCRWVQVRMKDAEDATVRLVIEELAPVFKDIGATLIVDDRVELVLETDVDGVHLGRDDMEPTAARAVLGPDKIIGMTVNNLADATRAVEQPIDYIGMGPWRYTSTKKKLAPVLGATGIPQLIDVLREHGVAVPVVAIGGLTIDDVSDVLATGANGLAVSGVISHAEDPVSATRVLMERIKTYTNNQNTRQ